MRDFTEGRRRRRRRVEEAVLSSWPSLPSTWLRLGGSKISVHAVVLPGRGPSCAKVGVNRTRVAVLCVGLPYDSGKGLHRIEQDKDRRLAVSSPDKGRQGQGSNTFRTLGSARSRLSKTSREDPAVGISERFRARGLRLWGGHTHIADPCDPTVLALTLAMQSCYSIDTAAARCHAIVE